MKRKMAGRSGSWLGFTLIELLVVVAVIVLVVVVLMPTLPNHRTSARKVACAVNMHSTYTGLVYYEERYDRLPFAVEIYGYKRDGRGVDDQERATVGRVPDDGWWQTEPTCRNYGPDYPNNYNRGNNLSNTHGLRVWWQQYAGMMIDNPLEAMGCPESTTGKPQDTGNPDQRYGGHFGVNSGPGALMKMDKRIVGQDKVAVLEKGLLEYEEPDAPAGGSMRLDDVKKASGVGLFWDQGNAEMSHQNAVCAQGPRRYLPGYRNNRRDNPSYADSQRPELVWTEGAWTPDCVPGESLHDREAIEKSFQRDAFKGRHRNKTINIMYADGHIGGMTADRFVDGKGESKESQRRSRELVWGMSQ